MDNPNFPLMVVTQDATCYKVLDSNLDKILARVKGAFHLYRVSSDAQLKRKKTGEYFIRASVCKGPYKYENGRLTNA